MSELDLTVPAPRALAAVLRAQLDAGETMRLLVGHYGQALAAGDPDAASHVNVVLGGGVVKVPKLAGLSTVPNAVAYVLATKDFLLAIGSVGGSGGVGVPIGGIIPFGGAVAPSGFLACDGNAHSKTTYALLYSIIGGAYGESGGVFNVPDLRRRAPFGAGSSYGRGASDAKGESERGPWHFHRVSGSVSGSTGGGGGHSHTYRRHTEAGTTFTTGTQGSQVTVGLPGGFDSGTDGAGDHSHSFSGTFNDPTTGGGAQDAPGHLAVLYVIRAL